MQRSGFRLNYWLPAILWMAVIFSASTPAFSSQNTSRIIGPILRWFKPDISNATISRVQFVVRKGGHLTEFGILAVLYWYGCRGCSRANRRPWHWPHAALAFGLSCLYAAADEFHQSLVASRQGQLADVLIDAGGAAFGLIALYWLGRWRRRW